MKKETKTPDILRPYLPGMTWSSLKKVPELSPVWLVIGFGAGLSISYLIRLALFSPDVTWSRVRNPEPYQYYKERQYKFIDEAFEHVPKSRAPDY